ncbi:NADH:quinone oxidoreductase [Pseudomonas sp. P66]|jgi:electron transport complex protein RnfA|uniref:NADH:quinone oxidoreductase n=1 Tax=Pseudomonas arcuscaelestis TaxID=2710591 RepID=A0ABS2C5D2_9PSED|nr:Rnf-Nqr domain containing protein [Pseudomonas arcuscaelestis]MBM3110162.1 NADH:quinone oxidoreductase [Pseudomonas arcuscaelestis]MBM5461069.1 NADH:quinone oxidoreductase [Pseudomonas arcuscaelestis]
MSEFILALISAALVNNLILHQGLAIDPALQLSADQTRRRVHALGLATLALLVLTSNIGQLLYHYLLQPLQLGYLRVFILLPLCVLVVEPLLGGLSRMLPTLPFSGLMPLLLGNVALLGLSLQVTQGNYGALQALALSLGGGLGFWLALSLFVDLRERSDNDAIAPSFRGLPVELIGAGVMALAFLGFNGLFTS